MSRSGPAALLLAVLSACSSLAKEEDPTANLVTLGSGTIETVKRASLGTTEDFGSRIAIGFLAAGIPGLLGTSSVEDEFGQSKGWQYDIRLTDGKSVSVQSFAVLRVGDCVLVKREGPDGLAYLARQPVTACTARQQ